MKIGVLFGNPETTTGGNALKFYAAIRIDVRRAESIKEKGEVVGNRVRARIKKNKEMTSATMKATIWFSVMDEAKMPIAR